MIIASKEHRGEGVDGWSFCLLSVAQRLLHLEWHGLGVTMPLGFECYLKTEVTCVTWSKTFIFPVFWVLTWKTRQMILSVTASKLALARAEFLSVGHHPIGG